MKRLVRTPSGLLGLITLILLIAFATVSLFWLHSSSDTGKRTECIARQLAQPWIGLKESFAAPPGDTAARQRALDAIERGITRLEHLDKHC